MILIDFLLDLKQPNYFPHLILCRFSGFKTSVSPFLDRSRLHSHNFTRFIDDMAINKPSQIIRNLTISDGALFENAKALDISKYVKPMLTDVSYYGYCFTSDINEMLRDDERYVSQALIYLSDFFQEHFSPFHLVLDIICVKARYTTGSYLWIPKYKYIYIKDS